MEEEVVVVVEMERPSQVVQVGAGTTNTQVVVVEVHGGPLGGAAGGIRNSDNKV